MDCIHDCKKCESKCCQSCKFFWWFEERQEYDCGIKGCWNKSKWVEFKMDTDKDKK